MFINVRHSTGGSINWWQTINFTITITIKYKIQIVKTHKESNGAYNLVTETLKCVINIDVKSFPNLPPNHLSFTKDFNQINKINFPNLMELYYNR